MEQLVLTVVSFRIAGHFLPSATFHALMKVNAKVVVVLLLVTFLLSGLGTLRIHFPVVVLCWLCLFPVLFVSDSYVQSDAASQNSFPSFATLAWRGPPIS